MTFDPYHKWLGIPPEEQPPNYYRLLGIKVLEADPDVISTAADRQMSHIRSFQTGPNAALSQTLLNEISNARVCLLNREKKRAYDETLRHELEAATARRRPARAKRKYDPLTIGVAGAVVCILAIAVIVFLARKPAQQVAMDRPEPVASVKSGQEQPKAKEPTAQQEQPKVEEKQAKAAADPAPSAIAADPDRAAAETVFRVKGKITLEGGKVCHSMEELPAGELAIVAIELPPDHLPISDDDLRVIAGIRKPQRLYSLHLAGVPQVTDKGIQHLLRFSSLTSLVLRASQISDAGLEQLTNLRELLSLNIAGSKNINPAGIRHLRKFAKLKALWMAVAGAGRFELESLGVCARDELVMELDGLDTVTDLGIGYSDKLTDASLEHLKTRLKGLQSLLVPGTSVTEAGARAFHAARPEVRIAWGKGQVIAAEPPAPTKAEIAKTPPKAETTPMASEPKAEEESATKEETKAPAKPEKETTVAGNRPAKKRSLAQLASLLRKKLRGRVSFDPKTEQFTLTYDWTTKVQLQDFDQSKAKLTFVRGRLPLQPGESVRHVVDFKEVTIAALVMVPQMKGTLIWTSGGARAYMGGSLVDAIFLDPRSAEGKRGVEAGGGERVWLVVPENQRKGIQPIQVSVTPNRLAFSFGPSQIGTPVTNFHAGQVELSGGEVGFQYGKLVFTGVFDEKWLESFVEE